MKQDQAAVYRYHGRIKMKQDQATVYRYHGRIKMKQDQATQIPWKNSNEKKTQNYPVEK
jgi:hypothetical protein